MRLSVSNHGEKAATRVRILLVILEMLRKLIDAFREDRDLHLGRAGILVVDARFLDDLLLSRFR